MRPKSLAAALLNSYKSLATDPRDKIYALLGLSSDGSSVIPLPNYSYDASTIAIQAARRMIKGQRRISALLLARRRKRDGAETLPSWMPDLLHLDEQYAPWIADRIDDSPWMNQVDIGMTNSRLELPCSFVTSVFSVSRNISSRRKLHGVFQGPDDGKQIARDDLSFLYNLHGCLTLWGAMYGWIWPFGVRPFRRGHRSLFNFVSQCLGKTNQYVPKGLRQWVKANADLETGNGTLEKVLKRIYRWSVIASSLSRVPSDCRQDDCEELEAGLRQLDRFNMRIAVIGEEPNITYTSSEDFLKVRRIVKPVFEGARAGDKICYLPSCTLPVVLREEGDCYRYIGEVYASPNEVEKHRSYERVVHSSILGRTSYVEREFSDRICIY